MVKTKLTHLLRRSGTTIAAFAIVFGEQHGAPAKATIENAAALNPTISPELYTPAKQAPADCEADDVVFEPKLGSSFLSDEKGNAIIHIGFWQIQQSPRASTRSDGEQTA